MHILIVEDDMRTAHLLEEPLGTGGHQVASFRTGEEGLAWLRREPVDLVVLDVKLPGRDGTSICAEMRSFSSVRILMLSARCAPVDRVDGLRQGADDHLAKPFHAQELLARVDALARRGHRQQGEPLGLSCSCRAFVSMRGRGACMWTKERCS